MSNPLETQGLSFMIAGGDLQINTAALRYSNAPTSEPLVSLNAGGMLAATQFHGYFARLASVALDPATPLARATTESFNIEHFVRVGSAVTRALRAPIGPDRSVVLDLTVMIEDLNLLGLVTATQLELRLRLQIAGDGQAITFVLAGTRFQNLQVTGHTITPHLLSPVTIPPAAPTVAATIVPEVKLTIESERAAEVSSNLGAILQTVQQWPNITPIIPPSGPPTTTEVISFVDGFDSGGEGETGFTLLVPDMGSVSLGRIQVNRGSGGAVWVSFSTISASFGPWALASNGGGFDPNKSPPPCGSRW